MIAHWLETLSRNQFLVEHHPGKKHGNADALSCQQCNPYECTCPFLDEDEELLQCGPCHKCKHRSQTMQSDMGLAEGDLQLWSQLKYRLMTVDLQVGNAGISKSHW